MKVNEKCECVDCPTCNGSGSVWVSGDRMSANRFDDMGDLETCPDCNGEGISVYCLKCVLESQDADPWDEDEF
jgi:DnaJ-class molecular chaperone